MSSTPSSSINDKEMSDLRLKAAKKTTLVKSLFRVLYCFEQYLGIEDTPELKTQFDATLNKVYKEFAVKDEEVDPDDILSATMLSFLRNDVKGRFDSVLFSIGTKAKHDVKSMSLVNLHVDAMEKIKHPFYTFSVCMYQDPNLKRDDGFTALALCADQVFFDNNDEERLTCFNVRDIRAKMGVDPNDILVTSVFILQMKECDCGCHEIIQNRVKNISV